VRPGSSTDGGDQPPPHRPDIPCETQELPNLHAPGGPATSFPGTDPSVRSAHTSVSARQATRLRQALGAALPKALREERIKTAREERTKLREKKSKGAGR
jgi:hypothetical protein